MGDNELRELPSGPVRQTRSASFAPPNPPSKSPDTNSETDQGSSRHEQDGDSKPGKGASSWWFFVVIGSLYLGTFLVAVDTAIIGTVIPAITTEFHALDEMAWYGSGYLLTLTALQPTLGKLYKILDTKLLYLASIAVFEVGSIMCAVAPPSPVFITGRAVAGCGAAGIMQGSFAIVTKIVVLSKRPFYFGLFVSAFGVSIGVGPVLGRCWAALSPTEACGDGVFGCQNLPLGAMVILIVAAFLRLKCTTGAAGRPKHSAKHVFFRLDPAASILLIASVCCLLVAMQRGGQHLSWTSPKIIGLFTVSGILFALFLGLEWRTGDDASVPFNILRRRSIAFGAVYLFLFSMPNFSYGIYIPVFFQAVKGFSAQRSGAETLSLALTQIIVVVAAGALVSRLGYYTPFIIGGTAISMVGSGLITNLDLNTTHATWVGYFLLCGFGAGSAINLPYTAVTTTLNEEDMVTGNAILQFAFQLGGAVSLCISQTIFLSRLVPGIRSTARHMTADEIIAAGAGNLRALTDSPETLHVIRLAYREAVRDVFIFLLVAGGLAFLGSFGFEHKNVKTVEEERRIAEGGATQAAEVA